MVVLGGRGAHQDRRAYTLSGSPENLSTYRITVRHTTAPEVTLPDGLVSSSLLALKTGDHIHCTAPFGEYLELQKRVQNNLIPVLLSHGLGISPTLSLLYELEAMQLREVFLFHEPGTHDPQGLLREVNALIARNPGFKMIHAASGLMDTKMIQHHVPLAQAQVHIAGPRSFTGRLVSELNEAGLPTSALMVQSF
jgi:ferredoxin-NADP reductase